MGAKRAKLLTVPANGQISIGKSWAGKQIRVEEIGKDEIRISSGTFVPDSQAVFYTKEAQETLREFNAWESKKPSKATNTKALFASLRKKK
ncbi:MAG: hypothetical protein IT288_13870 [Bdellovibrionales bacterium]|nr:hypothetical protein [Bdellovibrionales bacterium]